MRVSAFAALGHEPSARNRIHAAPGTGSRRRFAHAFHAIMLVGLLLLSRQCGAQYIKYYIDENLNKMLPPYCKQDVTGVAFSKEEWLNWNALMGSGMDHIHHYCRGLNFTNIALFAAKSKDHRRFNLEQAINEYDYVLRNVDGKFRLFPEVLTKKGENLMRLGNVPAAMAPLMIAIERKPDYWPPYVVLIDYYRSIGNIPKAREWVDKGLAADPSLKVLQMRRDELAKAGGKPASTPGEKPARHAEKAPSAQAAEKSPAAEPSAAAK